jgi:hypothetical protein
MSGDTGHPLVRKIMDYQLAVAAGDMESARSVFQPDVEYRVPGRSLLAGTYHGPDEVIGYFGRLMELTGGTYRISRMTWFAAGDEVALATRNHATRDGRTLEWDEVILFTFEDGRKKRIDLLSGDQYGMDELFAKQA